MNNIKKTFILFFIFMISGYHLSINASNNIHSSEIKSLIENIAKSSTIFIVNFALDELQNKIKLDMKNKNIRAIVIKDLFLDDNILVALKDKNNNISFVKVLPKNYRNYKKIKHKIIQKKSYTNNILAELTLYYEENINKDKLINLTQKEKTYLDNKKIIKMCIDPNWMPFEMIKGGKHIGITSDYIKIFSEKIDTDIKLVQTNSWIESLIKSKNRECDILSLISKTKNRETFMDFTSPYIITPIVIATKVGITFIDDIAHILDKKLGVVKGYSLFETLKEKYPNINLVEVSSLKDGLRKVEQGKLFGYIDNTIVINYEIQKNFIGTITVSGKLNDDVKLSVATRYDEKILNGIFEKIILSIDENTKHDILTKWVKVNYSIKTDYTLVWKLALISLFIIFITIYWNRKLSKLNKELSIQRDKSNEATKAKSEFLANMSHEIRTPMNGIIGMSSLALKSDLNEKSRGYIQNIDFSAKSLLNILNDILDFSKIEAGKLKIEKIDFNLDDLIDSVINLVKFKADEKNIEIIVEYGVGIPKELNGDSLRISQILTNLMGNAVKFTSNGVIGIYINNKNNIFRFEVKDTGIGIDKKQQNNLFHPFVQSDGSTTRKYGGTGLGLSISKQLVRLMDGKIWVESQKYVGSSFIFELELTTLNSKISNRVKQDNISLINTNNIKDLNILVVEDNIINQEIIVGLLEDSGVLIDLASNGKEAVDKFKNNNYKLILMDIQMPIMDGYEATKLIRKIEKECAVSSLDFENIPIIALSANAMSEDILKSKEAGMNEHLNKPIDINKLNETLLKYISKKSDKVKTINNCCKKEEVLISELNNIDSNLGLSYLAGNEKLYIKILNNFYTDYKDIKLDNLSDEEFKRIIHTLKGLSANIGAVNLHEILKVLDETQNRNLLTSFYKELDLVIEELKVLNKVSVKQDFLYIELTDKKRDKLFEKLKESVITKRPKNCKVIIDDIDKYNLSIEDEDIYNQVKTLIQEYKFNDAINLLNNI